MEQKRVVDDDELTEAQYQGRMRKIALDKASWTIRRTVLILLVLFLCGLIGYIMQLKAPTSLHELGLNLSFSTLTYIVGFWVFGSILHDKAGSVKTMLSNTFSRPKE